MSKTYLSCGCSSYSNSILWATKTVV